MSTFTIESLGEGQWIVVLERSFEAVPHLVFRGVNNGLVHRISTDQVIDGKRFDDTLRQLQVKPWMTDGLLEQFKAEVTWLRAQG